MTELQVKVDIDEWGLGEDPGEFRRSQEIAFRKMSLQGRGDWWGAFMGDELVGSMGLFFDRERRVGRFQNVATAAEHRRKGICSTLLDEVSRMAFDEVGVSELIINTGDAEDNPAKLVYQSLGYADGVKSFGLSIANRKEITIDRPASGSVGMSTD